MAKGLTVGIVNDSLPPKALGELHVQPNRDARFALGYGRYLNVTREFLDRHLAAGLGNRPAIKYQKQIWTYNILSERVNRLANALAYHGIKPGCRVLIHLPNAPEFIESWLAVLRIGAIVVATTPTLRQRELSQIVEETKPGCLITTSEMASLFNEYFLGCNLRIFVGKDANKELSYEKYIALGKHTCEPLVTTEDDVALIAYTSGSTGQQKGTVHTHSDILAIADTYASEVLAPRPRDCFGCHAPMAFTYGLGALLVFPLRFGASTIIDSAPFDPGRWLHIVRREGVTRLFATPTATRLYLDETDCLKHTTWKNVRSVVSAGEPLSQATFDRWREVTGTEILDGCGSTEMLHIWISQRHGEVIGGCTGRPVSHYQIQLIDDNGCVIEEPEAEGEAAIQGPTGCRYWLQPDLQSKVVINGWTMSGDIFRRDLANRYKFISRTDDIIVSGGYKISPAEVQETILQHPAVLDVAVIGVPDILHGQVVRAYVISDSGFGTGKDQAFHIREYTKTKIASFKSPRQIVFLDEFPKTATGKVDRFSLKTLNKEIY